MWRECVCGAYGVWCVCMCVSGVVCGVREFPPRAACPCPSPLPPGRARALTHLCSGHSEADGVGSPRRPGGSLSSPLPTAEQLATILAHISLSYLICKVVSVTDPQERPVGAFSGQGVFSRVSGSSEEKKNVNSPPSPLPG